MLKTLFFFLMLVLIYNYIPNSQLRNNNSFHNFLVYYFPQGWGYFTKDPTENQFDFYHLKDRKIIKIDFNNGNLSKNFLGITKKQRMINYEYTFLLSRGKKIINWTYNTEINHDSIIQKNKPCTIYNKKKLNFINDGDSIVVVLNKIIPFKWENYQNKRKIPNMLALIVLKND